MMIVGNAPVDVAQCQLGLHDGCRHKIAGMYRGYRGIAERRRIDGKLMRAEFPGWS